MAIVGISGHIGSGKSLVSSVFCDVLDSIGKRVLVKSFAYPIYKIVSDLTDLSIEEIKRRKRNHVTIQIKDKVTNYRNILQTIGNGLREYGGDDIWIDSLFGSDNDRVITDLTWINDWWIIEDLRYPNEAQRIKSLSGKLIRIERKKSEDNEHTAETSLDNWKDWDLVIENNYSSVEEAKKEINTQVESFVKEVIYG